MWNSGFLRAFVAAAGLCAGVIASAHAQGSVSPATLASIQAAAARGEPGLANYALESAVMSAIIGDPRQIEAVMAAAVAAAPYYRDQLVREASEAFPGYASRIVAGAGGGVVAVAPGNYAVAATPTPSLAAATNKPPVPAISLVPRLTAPPPPEGSVMPDPPPPVIEADIPHHILTRGYYLEVGGGLLAISDGDLDSPAVSAEIEHDTGYVGSAVFGFRFNEKIRLDAELAYRANDIENVNVAVPGVATMGDTSGELRVGSALLNAYYDYPVTWPIRPYIGFGIGAAQAMLEFDSTGFDEEEIVFAYQVHVGARYPLTDWFALRAGYKLFGTTDPDFSDAVETGYLTHNVEGAVVVAF